jgi:hypothetical protein
MYTKQSDIKIFIEHWDVEPVPDMVLEILDKTDWDVYTCVVTRTDTDGIWVKRDDRDTEELADVVCLQTPSDEDDEDGWE